MRHTLLRALTLTALLGPGAAQAVDPEHVAALVQGGATQLALRLVESQQKADMPFDDWVRWESQRLSVLKALRRWSDLAHRVDALPSTAPAAFRRAAIEAAAEARLAANDPAGARRYLRQLLWQEQVSGEDAARTRRLIIRSYLQQGLLEDAQTALLLYQRDYQARSEPWLVLHAEILVQAGKARAAANALAGLQSFEARLLRLLAGLRGKVQSPREVLVAANKLADTLSARPELQRVAWIVAAEAATVAGDGAAQIIALERALSLPENGASSLYRVSADDLWRAYETAAERMGNAAKLLVGNDEEWLDQAESVPCTENHVARAWYAFLAQRASEADTRRLAHRRLAAGLMREGRAQTLEMLYTRSTRFPVIAEIPPEVRYALADKAIADYNIRLAGEVVRGLDTPPEGEAPEDWALRRARILVYAGEYKTAAVLLDKIITGQEILDPALTARLLQVLFDLQAVERHDDAARLLQAVYERVDNDKLRRELLFWMADSQNGLKRYEVAAEMYLRSASFGGASGEDPWGHTARFHAAEALGRAGLIDDARRVYVKLMESTPDPRRRAQIERQVQQLWVQRKGGATP
jgi:hypothetical protein